MEQNNTRAETAQSLFCRGFNCAQAVFCAFCDKTGIPFTDAARMSAGLGGGMGRLREVCGAVSGAVLALSCLEGYADPNDAAAKAALYARVQTLGNRFKEKNKTLVCRELLAGLPVAAGGAPAARSEEFYQTRPCARLVFEAAEILEAMLCEKEEGGITP